MRVDFELSEQDLADATGRIARRQRSRWVLLALCAPAALAALLLGRGSIFGNTMAFVFLGTGVVGSVWAVPARAVEQAIAAHRQFPEFHGVLSYEFTDHGMSLTSPASRIEVPWSIFTRASEDAAFLYLEARPEVVYFIPKPKLNADSLEQVRAVWRTHLGVRAAAL